MLRHRTAVLQRLVRQQGMAVIAVLLIVAVIAVLAASLLGRQAMIIRSLQGEQIRAQARWLLRGEVGRAQLLLRDEARRDVLTRAGGAWSLPVHGRPAGQLAGMPARISSELIDEQGKFNLRNLVVQGAPVAAELAAFSRLCELLGVEAEQAALISRRVVLALGGTPGEAPAAGRRVEEGDVGRPGVAGLRPRVVEDLLAVPGVEPASLARLKAYVTMLPQPTWVNANTARAEVIAAQVPGLPLERAQALLQARDRGQWFLSQGDFAHRLQMPELDSSQVRLGVNSRWFQFAAAVEVGRTKVVLRALMHDDKQSLPRVLWLREGA